MRTRKHGGSSRYGVGTITVFLRKGFVRASDKGYRNRLTLLFMFNLKQLEKWDSI